MKKTRRITGVSMLLLLYVAVALVTWWAIIQLNQPMSALQKKRESTDLVRSYVVEASSGPAFLLKRDDSIIKLISHAILPEGMAYDPRAKVAYGFRLRVLAPDGREIWTREVYTDSRQSKEGFEDGFWLHENAFSVTPGVELSDDRLLEIRLPDEIPENARLEVRLAGPACTGQSVCQTLLRVYRRFARSATGRRLRQLGLTVEEKQRLSQRVGAPWDRLRSEVHSALVGYRWERMAALGEDGIDYETRRMFYDGFRNAPAGEAETQGVRIDALHRAAINVEVAEDTTLGLFMVAAPESRAQGDEFFTVVMNRVGDGGVTSQEFSVSRNNEGRLVPITVPPGLYSLHFATTSPGGALVRLLALPGKPVQFGYLRPISTTDGKEQLIVDERRLPAYLAVDESIAPPVVTYIDGPPDLATRLFQVEVRALMDGVEHTGPLPEFHYRFEDESGQVLGRGAAPFEVVLAPFEKVRRADGILSPVAEPVRFRMLAPRPARRLVVSTSRPSAVRVLTYLDDESRYEAPYCRHEPETVRWRYAPRERRPWQPVLPENRKLLADAGRALKVRAQVRLEPRAPVVTQDPDRHAVLIEPVRPPRRQLILDPVRPERKAEVAATWPPGAYTLIRGERAVRVLERAGGRPRLQYFVAGNGTRALGTGLEVKVDGAVVARRLVTVTRSVWNLPLMAPGVHKVACVSPLPELSCLIDQPPVAPASAELFRMRTVFPLDEAPLRLVVTKKPGHDLVVNAVIYAPGAGARNSQVVRVRIDSGNPGRNEGALMKRFTPADRWEPLPAAMSGVRPLFANVAGASPGYARSIPIRLGDDVLPGRHVIELYAPGLPAWVRFFTYDLSETPGESAWQWGFEAPETGSEGN